MGNCNPCRKIKVLLVEDQIMVRQLFELFINNSENYSLVQSLADASVAEVYCYSHPVDLVVMDVMTANGKSGLTSAAKIKKHFPNIRIVIVTSMPERSWLDRARKIGVDSFWYKEISEESIIEIMDRTMAGESVYPDAPPDVRLGLAMSSEFTSRELEVLRYMISGYQNTEIAERMYLQPSTVKTYIKQLLDKTGMRNRTELAVRARESGIVINDEEM